MVFCCSKEESLLESKKVAKAAVTFRGTNGFTTAQQHCVWLFRIRSLLARFRREFLDSLIQYGILWEKWILRMCRWKQQPEASQEILRLKLLKSMHFSTCELTQALPQPLFLFINGTRILLQFRSVCTHASILCGITRTRGLHYTEKTTVKRNIFTKSL